MAAYIHIFAVVCVLTPARSLVADNYHYGRQAMTSTRAWQTHGCYRAGSSLFHHMPIDKALNGCHDDWNSLDHLDPTSAVRHLLKHFIVLRSRYSVLQEGFGLAQHGNWTTVTQLAESPKTFRETGIWSVSRGPMANQTINGPKPNVTVWMVYSNLDESKKLEHDCTTALGIFSPYVAPITVRNLLFPYESYNLSVSRNPLFANGQTSYRACLPSITLDAYGFKVFVPDTEWSSFTPHLAKSTPGHDARILSKSRDFENSTIPITLMFSDHMSCSSVSSTITLTSAIDPSSIFKPEISNTSSCVTISPINSSIKGVPPAVWAWKGSIKHAADGIYQLSVNNATNNVGVATDSVYHLLIRKGSAENPMTFQNVTYSKGLLQQKPDGLFKIVSDAAGAELMRYSTDFGATYSAWRDYTSEFNLPADTFSTVEFWKGHHIRVQHYSKMTGSAAQAVDSDHGIGQNVVRRVPQLLLRGPFNQWYVIHLQSFSFAKAK